MMGLNERAKRLAFEFNTAIDDRLVELLIAGHKPACMHLFNAGLITQIWVHGEPDSEFSVEMDEKEMTIRVVGRSLRTPEA